MESPAIKSLSYLHGKILAVARLDDLFEQIWRLVALYGKFYANICRKISAVYYGASACKNI
jgi:hypothetical protein